MQSRLARGSLALALFAAVLASCSNNSDSTAPTPPITGPTFNFAFPAAGTAANPGTSNKLVFRDVGAWAYRCIPHGGSGMTGTVNVVVGAADSAFVAVGFGNALVFNPATVTIDTGGYVRWANVSSMTIHTVSRP